MSAVASTSRHTLRAAARRPLQVLPSTSGRTFRAKHTSFHTPSDRPLRVLGIESSADDSCCAIVTSDRQILSNQVVKQHHINAKYGGIHPLRAQEGHAAGVVSTISRGTGQGCQSDIVSSAASEEGEADQIVASSDISCSRKS